MSVMKRPKRRPRLALDQVRANTREPFEQCLDAWPALLHVVPFRNLFCIHVISMGDITKEPEFHVPIG